MKRFLLTLGLVFALLVPASAAFARDIFVGNCANGRITTVTHSDPWTGDTNIIVCDIT